MTSTVIENAQNVTAHVVKAETLHVSVSPRRREGDGPSLGWYPRSFFRAEYLPDRLLDMWAATGLVRVKKVDLDVKQSTTFFSYADVVSVLEGLPDAGRATQI